MWHGKSGAIRGVTMGNKQPCSFLFLAQFLKFTNLSEENENETPRFFYSPPVSNLWCPSIMSLIRGKVLEHI